MQLGYIQCRDGVTWTPKKQILASLSWLGKGGMAIENGAAENSSAVYAYKCEDCKKIIIVHISHIAWSHHNLQEKYQDFIIGKDGLEFML